MASSRPVKVVVLGDAETGKTSLISTAATDTFEVRPPPVLPPTRLPAEFTPDHTSMQLSDTSSRPEDQKVTDVVIQQSDAAVICFDAKRPGTLESVRTVWYPRVQRLNPNIPVILACCKADRLDEERDLEGLKEVREGRMSGWAGICDACVCVCRDEGQGGGTSGGVGRVDVRGRTCGDGGGEVQWSLRWKQGQAAVACACIVCMHVRRWGLPGCSCVCTFQRPPQS